MNTTAKTILGVVLVVVFSFSAPAVAYVGALAQKATTAESARWAVAPAPPGAPPTYGSYTITWSVNQGTAYHYFDAVNSGSQSLTNFNITVQSSQSSGGNRVPVVTFEACTNGSWNASTHQCSGTVVALGQTTTDATSMFTTWHAPISEGNRLPIRARTSPNSQNSLVSTVSLSASRDAVRSAHERNQ